MHAKLHLQTKPSATMALCRLAPPLLASTFAAIIYQFGFRELYELRERGRVTIEELLLKTKSARPETLEGMTALE